MGYEARPTNLRVTDICQSSIPDPVQSRASSVNHNHHRITERQVHGTAFFFAFFFSPSSTNEFEETAACAALLTSFMISKMCPKREHLHIAGKLSSSTYCHVSLGNHRITEWPA